MLLEALYLMLPSYFADMAPVFFSFIPWRHAPLDHGMKYKGRRILGDHKTYRGLIAELLVGVLIVWLQYGMSGISFFRDNSLLNYGNYRAGKIVVLGLLLGGGAVAGDAVKSFFKRRRRIPPGSPWLPYDHIDYTIGSLIGLLFFYVPSLGHIAIILLVGPLLHFASNYIGYLIGIRENPL